MIHFWAKITSLNVLGAVFAFVGTWVIVWSLGLALFGSYVVDLARISLVLLPLELLPTSYSLFRQQTDKGFADAYPAFYGLAALVLPLIGIALINIGAMETPSWFMSLYLFAAVIQRYLDCQFQATGQIGTLLLVPAVANVVRTVLLLIGILAVPALGGPAAIATSDLLWGSLALGAVGGLIIPLYTHPNLIRCLACALHRENWSELWSTRKQLVPYYLNSVLKRLKDVSLPFICSAALNPNATGLVLVCYRSVDFSLGQLRLLESVFTNIARREQLKLTRSRIALLAAFVGQLCAICAAVVMLWREHDQVVDFLPAFVLSFIVYPYVTEILARNDALARGDPSAVSLSLIAYVGALGFILGLSWLLGQLGVYTIAGALLISQASSAAAYRLQRPIGAQSI